MGDRQSQRKRTLVGASKWAFVGLGFGHGPLVQVARRPAWGQGFSKLQGEENARVRQEGRAAEGRRKRKAMSGGNGEGPSKKRMSGGAAMARLAGETSDNMKKPNDGKGLFFLEARLQAALSVRMGRSWHAFVFREATVPERCRGTTRSVQATAQTAQPLLAKEADAVEH